MFSKANVQKQRGSVGNSGLSKLNLLIVDKDDLFIPN